MKQRILLVEGKDDREVVYQFCNRHDLDNRGRFNVEATDGVEDLITQLPIRARSSITHLGVVLDADTDPQRRWTQVSEALGRVGYDLPAKPSPLESCWPGPSLTSRSSVCG